MTHLAILIGRGIVFQKLWIADRSPWRWGLALPCVELGLWVRVRVCVCVCV